MPHLNPPTLTQSEQKAILRATAGNVRDHVIYTLTLDTGLRLSKILWFECRRRIRTGRDPALTRQYPSRDRQG